MDAAEYAILLALAAVGGVGVPVVGDAALIAAALAAADGHLSIAVVLIAAFMGHEIGPGDGVPVRGQGRTTFDGASRMV